MPLASPKYPFQEWAIRGAPDDPGLYALYRDQALLCIGIATGEGEDNGIRARLFAHFKNRKSCAGITHYQWQISRRPHALREQYMRRLAELPEKCEDRFGSSAEP